MRWSWTQLDLIGHDPKPASRWPCTLRDYGRQMDRTRYSRGGKKRNTRSVAIPMGRDRLTVKPLTLQRHGLQIDSAGVVAGVVVPASPLSPGSGNAADRRPVRKRRRGSRFSLVSGQIVARAPGLQQEPGCEVELAEIRTLGQDWWTLGFGTTGPPICSAANWRPPPRSCSTSPCPVAWNPARTIPDPMPSG